MSISSASLFDESNKIEQPKEIIVKSHSPSVSSISRHLVALVLFGDVPKWLGQGNFEDTSGTYPGRVRDMSVQGHIFGQVWERT